MLCRSYIEPVRIVESHTRAAVQVPLIVLSILFL
jgi:hypothetical protein